MEKYWTLEEALQEQEFIYRSFYEELTQRLNAEEIASFHVLGREFFQIVDHIALGLFEEHAEDSELLGISLQQFLWELQIFANQFLRSKSRSALRLRIVCSDLTESLKQEHQRHLFAREVSAAYEEHFFGQESRQALLV